MHWHDIVQGVVQSVIALALWELCFRRFVFPRRNR